jgi:hypothetical protein
MASKKVNFDPSMTEAVMKQHNWYGWLINQAEIAGVSIRELCRNAGYDYDRLYRWRHGNPKSVQVIYDIEVALETAKANKGLRRRTRKYSSEA